MPTSCRAIPLGLTGRRHEPHPRVVEVVSDDLRRSVAGAVVEYHDLGDVGAHLLT